MQGHRPLMIVALIVAAAISDSVCLGDTFETEIPIDNRVNQLDIDLGTAVTGAVSITISASGHSRAALVDEGEFDATDLCLNPQSYPPEMYLLISSDDGARLGTAWNLSDDGSFAIADTLHSETVFNDGRAQVELEFWYRLWIFYQVCAASGHACPTCQTPQLEFDNPPILRIEYNPLVGQASASWGSVKAVYR
ncbi:MAG: hypothetical protein IPK64_18055 [bacterium]|nr:hypothetical protein [bacterium]